MVLTCLKRSSNSLNVRSPLSIYDLRCFLKHYAIKKSISAPFNNSLLFQLTMVHPSPDIFFSDFNSVSVDLIPVILDIKTQILLSICYSVGEGKFFKCKE